MRSRRLPAAMSTPSRESLTIVGWVAMWRPVEIFLYDWWPLVRRIRVYKNLLNLEHHLRMDDHSRAKERPQASRLAAKRDITGDCVTPRLRVQRYPVPT